MKISGNFTIKIFCLLTSVFFFSTTLLSQQTSNVRAALLEIEDDPYLETPRINLATQPAYAVDAVDFFTRQVNVDSNGDDMIGDAANEPSIAVDPTNPSRIIIGWRQFDNISSNFRQAGFGFSSNEGMDWAFPGAIDPGLFRSDPVLDFDVDGTIYYNSLQGTFECDVFTINPGGFTIGSAVPARGGDKQWVHVDKSNSEGAGHYYSYWNTSFTTCAPGAFTRSTDNAQSFESCVEIDNEPFWGTLATAKDGTLYITGRNGAGSIVLLSSSNAKDASTTVSWDAITNVDLDGQLSFFEPINPQGLSGQAWVEVDTSNGPGQDNIYVLATVERNSIVDPADVMFSRSLDGGATFEAPIRVNTDTGTAAYQWFGTMSVAPNGRIDVVWLDTRDSPIGTNESVLYYSFSDDQGNTWSENTAISESFDPNIGYPQQDKMGDYFDMVSDNNVAHLAWAATFNGGQDVYYSQITPNSTLDTQENSIDTYSLNIFPNPIDATSILKIALGENKHIELVMYDILGREVILPFETKISKSKTIALTTFSEVLSNGVYFLTVRGEQEKQTLKIVVQ